MSCGYQFIIIIIDLSLNINYLFTSAEHCWVGVRMVTATLFKDGDQGTHYLSPSQHDASRSTIHDSLQGEVFFCKLHTN
jgi:hypothetical protein